MSSTHKAWWLLLIGGSLAVPLAISGWGSPFIPLVMLSGMIAVTWLVAAALLTAIPAGLYRLIYERLTSREFLSMYTAAWVFVAVALFWHIDIGDFPLIMFVMGSLLMEFPRAIVLALLIVVFAGWLLYNRSQTLTRP